MQVQRIAAFARDGQGGNPAGVVLVAALPDAAQMQALAADVGYSETAFAAPEGAGFRVRYFAPDGEVPFCGHATIALGAALGAAHGAGEYPLHLNQAVISVRAETTASGWGARLVSPPTSNRAEVPAALAEALALFGLDLAALDPTIPAARINGGAEHLLLPLARRETLAAMVYDQALGAALMRRQGYVTILLCWREPRLRFHARNAFAGHGVYEDPATGAAAAALGGYLRDRGLQDGPFEIVQGEDMGQPSLLFVTPLVGRGAGCTVAGATRPL